MTELIRLDPKTCVWALDDPDWNTWKSECGAYWNLVDSTPEQNGMKFCPFCSKILFQRPLEEEQA